MGRRRRPKRPKIEIAEPREEEEPEIEESTEVRQRERSVANVVIRPEAEKNRGEFASDEFNEANVPFCCAVCKCSDERKRQIIPQGDDVLFEPHQGLLCHRRCCHGADGLAIERDDWSTQYLKAQEAMALKMEEVEYDEKGNPVKKGGEPEERDLEWVSATKIEEKYKTSLRQQSQLYNDDGEAHPESILATHPDYHEGIVKPFKKLVKQMQADETKKGGIVVLDMFAGIGTAIVVLKRLKIDIKKVIHVEHDKVATHVYRENHDCTYNPDLPDDGGIEHVFFETFEDFQTNMESNLATHGPFDLVIGSPPCVDAVNALRQGTVGDQGQYMVQFGQLIRGMERLQQPHPLYFLAEYVFLRGDDIREVREVREAFGTDWDPVLLDAQYVSPCCRKRHFISNIPLDLGDFDFQGESSFVSPDTCLEEGFHLPAHIVDREMTAKASCFMASSSRIDERSSLRMYVFRDHEPGKPRTEFLGRPINVGEREAMMGYPRNYVEKPVRDLFKTLLDDGHTHMTQVGPRWTDTLDRKLHHFAGNYHAIPEGDAYQFAVPLGDSGLPEIVMRMAPPQTTSKPDFFDAEEYAKHLIGLAYSVPVVELLLNPLQALFLQRRYPRYDEPYEWARPPARPMVGDVDDRNQEIVPVAPASLASGEDSKPAARIMQENDVTPAAGVSEEDSKPAARGLMAPLEAAEEKDAICTAGISEDSKPAACVVTTPVETAQKNNVLPVACVSATNEGLAAHHLEPQSVSQSESASTKDLWDDGNLS